MTAPPRRQVTLREVGVAALRGLPRLPRGARAGLVALRSDKTARGGIAHVVEHNARRFGALPAVRFENLVVSHAALDAAANRVARVLSAGGVARGDAVAVLIESRPEALVVIAALAKLGAVAAMLNTSQRDAALTQSVRVSTCRRAIVGDELAAAFAAVAPACGLAALWSVADRPAALAAPGAASAGPWTDLGAAAAAMSPSPIPGWDRQRVGDACFYIFTSGTTGLPKASVMTGLRWLKAGAAYGDGMLGLSPGDVVYAPLPLYHNMALTVGWASCATTGACLALRRRFSATSFWSDCVAAGAVAICYIGELPRYLLGAPPSPLDRAHRVTRMVGVGLRNELWRPFKQRFGIAHVFETYAASESNTIFLNALDLDETIGVCPTPHALVRYDVVADAPVRGPNGRMIRAAAGEVGLLLGKVTPRFDFDGYTDPSASEKKLLRDVFEAGDVWFNSGDLLRKVGWGHAQFIDRVGDTFRWKSENVSTLEVETVLSRVPGVAESTVYGVELPGVEGRAGMAAVVSDGDGPDLDALLRTCRAALPSYAVPVFVRVRPELQTTGTFKHQKGALRAEGYDPGRCGDPVYVLLPGAAGYTRVTPAIATEIARARW